MLSKWFNRHPTSATEKPLLNELEDLQQALHASPSINPDTIPVLDDIIESGSGKTQRAAVTPPIDQAESTPSLSHEPLSQAQTDSQEEQLDQLVQELVNELMPGLEAELRRKLMELLPQLKGKS